jgi:hypothetical protein
MRRLLALVAITTCVGCHTAEITLNYPIAGVYVAAKFEAKEPVRSAPAVVASAENEWNSERR